MNGQAYAAAPLKLGTHAVVESVKPSAVALSAGAAIRNATFDSMYYDLPALTLEELRKISGSLLAQGTVLMVKHSASKNGIDIATAKEFIASQKKKNFRIKTLVVPGVGSSALGAAALGRNVADYLGEPVAAIVPGYGAVDVLADASGGWYVLGANNVLLDMASRNEARGFKGSAEVSKEAAAATNVSVFNADTDWPSPMALMLNEASDVSVLRDIFKSNHGIRLLVGHSKGCLAIAFALHDFVQNSSQELPADFHVITIG
jgi:hypothetical protein